MDILHHFSAALTVTAPLLIILLAGIAFRKSGILDSAFVETGNKLVFGVALPCLLFLSVATHPTSDSQVLPLIIFALVATVLSVVIVRGFSPLFIAKDQCGVFTQCAFRGNMGIIGIALCLNAYDESILAIAAIYVAVLTISYNILAVLLLSNSCKNIFKSLLKNPLIIAIVLGLVWSESKVPVPDIMHTSLSYLAQLTLPLALVCIGASLNWQSLRANHKLAFTATALKLLVLPATICFVAIMVGIKGNALGVLFLMMGTPTAASAYVMSKQMTGQGNLAAEIITLSTLLSPITITLGLVALNYLSLI
ncbi:AEC family transporter [Neptunicella marina]|uniref:AEC family transporter n=1 Tax=Neptunicella marina TaxID=2125989 RepID=A0A8J6IVR7_9ALTE|nr:AEC family transporter [Neptunicella marina]MBC3766695.1 AEC family transporter [Neptunicella marina]